jgi:hypothetical protein
MNRQMLPRHDPLGPENKLILAFHPGPSVYDLPTTSWIVSGDF